MTYAENGNTIHNSLKWAITILKRSEIEFPEIDADALLAYVLSCDRTKLYTDPNSVIDATNIRKYKELIHKRAAHVPLQYITHRAEFMSLEFVVDERVLIPRPETEILVETVLEKAEEDKFLDKRITVMEIGTGSGNIAVSLAKYLTNAEIYTNDTSQDALTLAQTNVQRHKVVDKVHLLNGDFFNIFIGYAQKKQVDFIVSNPPYISKSEWHGLEPEVKDHEPWEALIGGEDGFCFYRRIIGGATDWLRPGGYLVIEIGETQANTVMKLLQNELHYDQIEALKDLQGKERIISARAK